jgi:hypothetical protein
MPWWQRRMFVEQINLEFPSDEEGEHYGGESVEFSTDPAALGYDVRTVD